jgi:DNA-binding phage protein
MSMASSGLVHLCGWWKGERMLELIYRITSESLWEHLEKLPLSQSRYNRFQFVLGNSLIHAAFQRHFHKDRQRIAGASIEIHDHTSKNADYSSADVLVVSDVLENAPLHVPVFCPEDAALVKSVPQAIAATLDWLGATEFLDVFERSSVVLLRQLLQEAGIQEFLRGILLMVRVGGEEGLYDSACALLGDMLNQRVDLSTAGQKTMLNHTAQRFLDHVCSQDNPHQLIKAYLSYHVFIKSNRNVSKASEMLSISRTTLHKHLRLAQDMQLQTAFLGGSGDPQ